MGHPARAGKTLLPGEAEDAARLEVRLARAPHEAEAELRERTRKPQLPDLAGCTVGAPRDLPQVTQPVSDGTRNGSPASRYAQLCVLNLQTLVFSRDVII